MDRVTFKARTVATPDVSVFMLDRMCTGIARDVVLEKGVVCEEGKSKPRSQDVLNVLGAQVARHNRSKHRRRGHRGRAWVQARGLEFPSIAPPRNHPKLASLSRSSVPQGAGWGSKFYALEGVGIASGTSWAQGAELRGQIRELGV